jgi:hypothetical protein
MSTQANRASDFLDTLGVNIHISQPGGSYGNVNTVINGLKYLGIDHVRDATVYGSSTPYHTLANAGIKFNLFVQRVDAKNGTEMAAAVDRLAAFATQHPGTVVSIEGPNEVNNWPVTYNSQTGTAGAQAFQHTLFTEVNADPVLKDLPILGFTDWPQHSGSSDWINIHPYSKYGDQPFREINWHKTDLETVDSGKPFAITETGYHTSLTSDTTAGGWEGVDQITQAKLTLNTYMDAFKLGSKATYMYELMASYADPAGSDKEQHFGLFDVSGNAKPAATAVHNLTTILADTGANAETFATGSLSYTTTGLPASGSNVLLQKSSGAYDIVLWNEPDIWNENTDTPITAPTSNVTVNLGATYASVKIYDPLVGTAPIKTLSNVSSVSVGVTDHPVIVEVRLGGETQ